ncbi:MAG: bifunctional UDP-N-acetylglucosamine diphosphorylase/glucosamine-1-phosphate N-acetyltransferase GlmU [Lactobacillales bacterium]|jgi:bifunctional UDP-N-acetylglucosamine pyrophosphorylase/glucosamine-1-phosphate N-acetyltransferase|nr:bifunctional UDP-N-acetylglucosamine diphosphorylase/glucosamine-1-phosphate N-acetyltransferase GlmU [Lactobacillales bacterium]
MSSRYAIILAAGKGTRMKSKLYKVLHKVSGKAMVEHVLTQVAQTMPSEIITIIGHGAEAVKAQLGERSSYVLQEEQLGTGHAVLQARALLDGKHGETLVISGDTPLLTAQTLKDLFEHHARSHASVTVLTAQADDPAGYGRIIRNHSGALERIVEQKDATAKEAKIQEINTGVYVFNNKLLFSALSELNTNNAQGEYYLTDIIEILKNSEHTVAAFQMSAFEESLGVNDRLALAKANCLMRKRINQFHMMNGVTLLDPASTYIEADVEIGSDTIIEGNVSLKGQTKIGSDVFIGSGSEIVDSILEDNTKVIRSVIENSILHEGADTGPFAHLRPKSELGKNAHVGNFVEIKASTLGEGVKAGHLTYVGDAKIGRKVNLGAGVIFVNYDGKNKFKSQIEDYAFIGSNSDIVAPIYIGKNAVVAAGSTVNQDVPEDALALGRARQVVKEGYAQRYNHYHKNDDDE